MKNNKKNKLLDEEQLEEDILKALGIYPAIHKQLTKEEFEQNEFQKYMNEEVEVTIKLKREYLEKFKCLKDYGDYEQGISIPTSSFIGDFINHLVGEKMNYFNLIQRIADGEYSLEKELRKKHGNRVIRLVPHEEKFRSKIRKIEGLDR
ncbi:hypothetical protein [Priestia megaterium]|uniref:hypothetical protein n=1 Tax=Priestia megaterium TaxID=1404 RepID=UPI002E248CB9|nr:hypothetical protein [Priestia megaterium]